MVDRPPPSRLSVVERGGRLVVIDRETGTTPPSAAERMAVHDARAGVEPVRPAPRPAEAAMPPTAGVAPAPAPAAERPPSSTQPVRPAPPANAAQARLSAGMGQRRSQPWEDQAAARRDPLASRARSGGDAPAPSPGRAAPSARGGTNPIVTARWWDAKGPRTLALGPRARAKLSGGVVTMFAVIAVIALVTFFIQPLVTFVVAFLLFRFGAKLLAPIGASLIDQALAVRE